MLEPHTRLALRRTIAVMNRKGGVGKTSITSNIGGVLERLGYRTLVIDLDSQGNLGDDLGYRDTETDDEGMGLFNALVFDQPLKPAQSIRSTNGSRLDAIPAGRHTTKLASQLASDSLRGEDTSLTLAEKLATIADQYDVILLDCPPGEDALQTQALAAAKWLLIPTQPDEGSLQGLSQVADRVVSTRHLNPTLELLGVVLFPVLSSAKRVQREVRTTLNEILGDVAPTFNTSIRFAQAAGVEARATGKLAIELAEAAEAQDPFAWKHDSAQRKITSSAGSVAADYIALAKEILQQLSTQEAALAAATKENN